MSSACFASLNIDNLTSLSSAVKPAARSGCKFNASFLNKSLNARLHLVVVFLFDETFLRPGGAFSGKMVLRNNHLSLRVASCCCSSIAWNSCFAFASLRLSLDSVCQVYTILLAVFLHKHMKLNTVGAAYLF